MNIVLGIIALLLIIFTIIYYLRFKKEVQSNKKMSDDYFEQKIKVFHALTIISIVVGIISFVSNFIMSFEKIYGNNDIDKYEEYILDLRSDDSLKSDLLLFPDKVEKDKVLEFKNYYKDNLFSKSYFISLKYNYDEENIDIEINRIRYFTNEVIEEENYELYIISNKEYVIREGNVLIYVYNQLFNKSDIDVNETYFTILG